MLASSSLAFTAGFLYLLISVALVISVPLPSGLPPHEYNTFNCQGYDPELFLPDPYADDKDIYADTPSAQGSGTNVGYQGFTNHPSTHLGQRWSMNPEHQGYMGHTSTHVTQGSSTNFGHQDYQVQSPATNQYPAPYPYFSPSEHNEGYYHTGTAPEHHYLARMTPAYEQEWSSQVSDAQSPSAIPTGLPMSWPFENYHVGTTNEELAENLENLNVEDSGYYNEEEHGEEGHREENFPSASASSKKKRKNKQRKRHDVEDVTDFELELSAPTVKWHEKRKVGSRTEEMTVILDRSKIEDAKKRIVDTVTYYVNLQDEDPQDLPKEERNLSLIHALRGISKVRTRTEVKRKIIKRMIHDVARKVKTNGYIDLLYSMTRAMLKMGLLPGLDENGKELPEPDPAKLDPNQENLKMITSYVTIASQALQIRLTKKPAPEMAIEKEFANETDYETARVFNQLDKKIKPKVVKDATKKMYKEWLRYKAVSPTISLRNALGDFLTEAMQDLNLLPKYESSSSSGAPSE